MTEFELIDRFFTRPARSASVRVGVGDDGAVIVPSPGHELVVSTDMLVSSRHFRPDVDPETLGHKTLAVNLSDMAAMAATPRWALLAGALPAADEPWLERFARGFARLADAHGVDLVGGDTTAGPLNLCVTIIGELPQGAALLRSGARPGDDVYVSGVLGDAALALAALEGRTTIADAAARAQCLRRLDAPEPRVALGIALRGLASAGLDVSDGLTGDLGHIMAGSGVGAEIDVRAVPRSATLAAKLDGAERDLALRCLLAGGDDYELCFTARPAQRAEIEAISTHEPCGLSRIGCITPSRGLVLHDGPRGVLDVPRAFDHFAARQA